MTSPAGHPAEQVRHAARRLAAVGSELETQGRGLAHAADEVNSWWTGDDGSIAAAAELRSLALAVRERYEPLCAVAVALLRYADVLDLDASHPERVRDAATAAIRAVLALSPNGVAGRRGAGRNARRSDVQGRGVWPGSDAVRHRPSVSGEAPPKQGEGLRHRQPDRVSDRAVQGPHPPWKWGADPPRQGEGLWRTRWEWGADPPQQGEGLSHEPPRLGTPPDLQPPHLPRPLAHRPESLASSLRGDAN